MKESPIQQAIMRFLDVALPGTYLAFAVPNGGKRDLLTGVTMKREGVKAGIADIIILSSGGYAACLEVKADKGRLSPAQKDFRDWCGSNGIPFAVVRSVAEVEDVLKEWNIKTRIAA